MYYRQCKLRDMVSKRQAPESVLREQATSLMQRCLVALLLVWREDRSGKDFLEMQFLPYIITLLCCWLLFLLYSNHNVPRVYVPSAMRILQRGTAQV
jgi:hypothetical protein